jgi:acyl-CoA thioester hydrolase
MFLLSPFQDIRKLGFSYASMEEQGVISPVVDLKVQYKKSIYYPEKVTVKTWVEKYSRLRSTYCYEVYNVIFYIALLNLQLVK